MAEPTQEPGPGQAAGGGAGRARPEPIPVMQRVLDNPFLLLFLGITIPTVFYLLWGIMELAQIPIAK